ncbi:hypothetical protein [Enterococcus innesii]|uniref:hypothetical protein n=1 Tax=Enterococcus innesii TaxID=2839759 RepID=UPI0032E514A5
MPVVQDEISLVKVANGDDGRGILGTPVATYAQSTSGTIPPTTWSTDRPNVPAGQYLWTRVVTTYTDNTTSETQTPTLMGKPGDPGLGIKSKSVSYAVGTTGNTPPTSGWQEAIPTVSENQYLWTRTTLVYTDDSKTDAYSVGKMGANGADAKLLYLTASAENMAFNADDTPKTTQTINISAKLQNVTGTATFTAIPYIGNTAQTAITLGGTGNTRTLTSAQWTSKDWTLIAITATLDNLTDTLSIVKVKDGKEGETYYPHRGYLMADGTLVNQVPNTNDLRIAQSKFFAYQGSTVSRTEGVSVPEWGATDAIRHVISGGTGGTVAAVMASGVLVKANVKYVHSVFIKNQGTTKIRLNNNLSQAIDVDPGETKRVIFNPAGNATGNASKQFVLYRINASDVQDFILWRPKIEESETTATYWTPSPLDDYENAYPKYEGFYSDTSQVHSTNPDDYKPWTPFMGPQGGQGPKGDSAPLISLSGTTQAITVDKDGKITPASSFSVTGTAVNTAISNWTYSLNGGNFGSAVPTGVTRSGNTVTINPATATFNQLTIRAADATVSDVYTISRIKDGGDGAPGSDAYTVFLTNESYTFAGSTSAALAGSTTTEVVVYKGINKITPTSVVVGTKPTGLSSSVSGSVVTFTAATTLVTKSGTVPITITVDGKTFTKQFAYAISFQGDPGISITGTEVQFVQTSSMTEPTAGWSTTRPTPVPGQWLWTRTRNKFSDNTYSGWVAVPILIGREAIVVSDTAPSNPSKGTLWQTPSDPNVKQWDGAKWIDWGISINNLVVENVTIENGVFKRIDGLEIYGALIVNTFDVWTGFYINDTDQLWRKGTTTLADSTVAIAYENYNKRTGEVIETGSTTTGVGGNATELRNAQGVIKRASSTGVNGIDLIDERANGSNTTARLGYNDMVEVADLLIPATTGFSQYATTGDNAPLAYRSGRSVSLTGAFKPNGAVTISADWVRVSTQLPIWARPRRTYQIRTQGTGMNTLLVRVTADGYIEISRYGKSDYVNLSGGEWLTIHMGYAGADIF